MADFLPHLRLRTLMEALPAELTIDILSRLPVKTILHCKRVCKKWRNLVLDSSFVNLHLSRSPTGLIIHDLRDDDRDPGIFRWVEIEDKVDHHRLHHDPHMRLDLNMVPVFQNSKICHKGSVNGLICLHQVDARSPKVDNTCICNLITREYMILPRQQHYTEDSYTYGFGVSSRTQEYKVVRTFQKTLMPSVVEAVIYTLGTGQWRSLGRVPYLLYGLYGGRFLNGHCHWTARDQEDGRDAPLRICTFDLDKETFQLFPSPPIKSAQGNQIQHQGLAVLKGFLYEIDTYYSQVIIWVMKEYGIKKSWHKEVVITQETNIGIDWPMWVPMTLVEVLKDGSILIVSEDDDLWAFDPRSGTIEDTEMFGIDSRGMAYRPSFLKLQNFESKRVHTF